MRILKLKRKLLDKDKNKRKMDDRNPYEELLGEMIRIRLVPHRSLLDLFKGRFTRRDLLLSYLIHLPTLVTVVRLAVPVMQPNWSTNLAFHGISYGRANYQAMNAVLIMLAIVGTVMVYSLLHISTCLLRIYQGFTIINVLRRHPNTMATFTKQLRIMWSASTMSRTFFMPVFIAMNFFDGYRNYWRHDRYFIPKTMFWQCSIGVHVFYVLSIGIVWSALITIVTMHLCVRYHKLHRLLQIMLGLGFRQRWEKGARMFMQVMHKLNGINLETAHFSRDSALFTSTFYNTIVLSLDGLLVVAIDWRTDSLIRMMAITSAICSFTISIQLFLLFASINWKAGRLVPLLNACLGRLQLTTSTLPVNFKLLEAKAHLEHRRFGISCGDSFTFTTKTVCNILSTFVLNLFLTIKLFKKYFLYKL